MSWFSKIFKRGRTTQGGGAAQARAEQKKCHFCGTNIISHEGGVMIGSDPVERMKHTGHWCFKCQVIACCPCSHAAAKEAGVGYFICPQCGANIHENML